MYCDEPMPRHRARVLRLTASLFLGRPFLTLACVYGMLQGTRAAGFRKNATANLEGAMQALMLSARLSPSVD
jgi:hypothetical protein